MDDIKYKCIKVPLNKIIKNDQSILNIINDAVYRANKITCKAYLLLRLWVLDKYHNNIDIPEIDTDIITKCIKSFLYASSGSKSNNINLINEFILLRQSYFGDKKNEYENGEHLNAILDYYKITMITCIENNIKMHYFSYIKKYVYSYFKKLNEEKLKNKNFRSEFYKELKKVYEDILFDQYNSPKSYHKWINEIKPKIRPMQFNTSLHYDITIKPTRYLKYMIFMCLELEKIEAKSFQFMPLQTNLTPKHVQIDTKAIIELLVDTKIHINLFEKCKNIKAFTKTELQKNIRMNKPYIWDEFFNITQKKKNYSFDHTIITDGYAASLRFIYNKSIAGEDLKHQKNKDNKKYKKEQKEQQEKQKLIDEAQPKIMIQLKKKTEPVITPELININISEKPDTTEPEIKKSIFITLKNIPEKVNNELLIESKQEPENTKNRIYKTNFKHKPPEFSYINEVDKIELKNKKCIFIDPGKRNLLSMMDDKGKFLNYTNKNYLHDTKRIKYSKTLEKYKKNNRIKEIEQCFNETNSKSCDLETFADYIDVKLSTYDELSKLYQATIFRKYKFFSYINTLRANDRMINKIQNTYSRDHIIIIGDWSIEKHMRHYISTPNLTLKRKLKKHFKLYNINEFRTSILHNKTENKCENLYLIDKKYKYRKMHSILTYKMENNRMGCINRDKNGCLNIKKVYDYYMEHGERPLKYDRSYKFD